MDTITLHTEAGQVSAELPRRGIAPATRVHVVVELPGEDPLPTARLAEAGGAFDWLGEEPDIYSEADIRRRPA